MRSNDKSARVAYSPSEFAALFGKSPTWGYRQLYSGKVKAISGEGRLAIPASEVERLTDSASIYSGKPTVKKKLTKSTVASVKRQKSWPELLKDRRERPNRTRIPKIAPEASEHHVAALGRMAQKTRKKSSAEPVD